MGPKKKDIFSKPYEDWAESASAKVGIRTANWKARITSKVSLGLIVCFFVFIAVGLVGLILKSILFGGYIFIPNLMFERMNLFAVLGVAFSITSIVFISKRAGNLDLEWFFVFASLPVSLLLALLFIGPSLNIGASIWTSTTTSAELDKKMVLYKSERSAGRGCGIRNEFHIEGEEGAGYWCTSRRLQTGVYIVPVKKSALGILVINLRSAEASQAD